MWKKINIGALVPILSAGIFSLLNLFDFYATLEKRVYDALLHVKPAIPEDPSILLLDVDDTAIANVGIWPWSREVMAEGLITMKEFGAAYAVFDIEYTEQSPRGIDSTLLQEKIPKALSSEFTSLYRNVYELFTALKNRQITLRDAEDYLKQLEQMTEQSKQALITNIKRIVRDNDTFLGQAARFFGNAYFTINMLPSGKENIPDELRAIALERLPLKKIKAEGEIPYKTSDIRPAILPILKPAAGAGFPNVEVDSDGVRRRLFLILEYQGKYFPQLAFSALYHKLGEPEIILKKDQIILEGAELPQKGKTTLRIPLAEDGTVLINWPRKTYWDSFRHLSYWNLEVARRQEEALVKNLELMDEDHYLSYHTNPDFLELYHKAKAIREEVLQGGDLARIEEYKKLRQDFFKETEAFVNGGAESSILAEIDGALATGKYTVEQKAELQQIRSTVVDNFKNLRSLVTDLLKTRQILAQNLPGSFCIIGNTATSTTDLGVNPFVKKYENVGTHASIANTILQGQFLDDLHWGYAGVAALLLSLLVYFILRNMDPLPSILIGIGFVFLVMTAGTVLFVTTGIYSKLLTPTLAVFFTFLTLAFVKFLKTAKEKSYIRNAFGHYLSTDVINELLTNPDKLKLGGEKKYITAMFTDVKGFSTISEQLDPADLVKLLNEYLSAMSDIILEMKGTIDKYEGDAIISFFGAPLELPDHAVRACKAAIQMKKIETELNKKFLETGMAPTPLLTRIGINTGDMVVGNMGTARKMDYTIMGNSVNLAARLEGVNKQYGTWILTSEYTMQNADSDLTVRKLDRVRVVGIQTPVRLFEVIEEKSQTSPELKEAVAIFHAGLDLFEEKNWKKAEARFEEVLKILPEDGPASTFLKRCQQYIVNPPPENWDGVFNLTTK